VAIFIVEQYFLTGPEGLGRKTFEIWTQSTNRSELRLVILYLSPLVVDYYRFDAVKYIARVLYVTFRGYSDEVGMKVSYKYVPRVPVLLRELK
jgi:hypothetical protein